MSRAIVTVGIHPTRGFGKYLERFRRTFAEYGCADEILVWDQDWPPRSPSHFDAHYAFKVFAVAAAMERGHHQVLWFDSSANAIRSVEPLWQRLERDGHVLIEDNEALGKWVGDRTLEYFGVTRDEAMGMKLLCGACWGVDITARLSQAFTARLLALATPEHFNGTHRSRNPDIPPHPRPGTEGASVSDDPRCWGHRSDEAVMSLLAHQYEMKTHVGVEFVGGLPGRWIEPTACVRSGYDLP